MNWKGTAALGALLAVALGVYFFHSPDSGVPGKPGPGGPQKNKLFADFVADRLDRIDILRKGETVTTLDRATDPLGTYWRIAPPVDKPADTTVVQQMLYGLDRFVNSGGMDPGSPGTAPAVTGLDDPRLVVTFHGPQGLKGTVRFGRQPPTNSTAVFFQKEGDPKIYLATQEVFDAYDKPATAIRQKLLVRYSPHQVIKVELKHKFIRVRQGEAPKVEYEASTMEWLLDGVDSGWWLTSPHREKLDDLKVKNLVTDLSSLAIDDWRPAGVLSEQGFDQPEERVSIWLHGREAPVVVLFGDLADLKQKRFVHVEGSGEVARIDNANRYMRLALERRHFRADIVFPFGRDSVKTFQLEARGLGKVSIERRETKNPGTGLVTSSWELLEPKPSEIKIEKERMEAFVGAVLSLRIANFLGAQDPKMARLDTPAVTLAVGTRDGKGHVCHFTDRYMRREGMDELFEVGPELVEIMRRLELNFLHPEVFNVPRQSLQEFTFESRPGALLKPVYYTVKFTPEDGKWRYVKPDSEAGKEPNPNLVQNVTVVMNYIAAESFIARDPALAAREKLDERNAPATLTVRHEGGKAVFFISEDKSDKVNRPIYYARLDPSPVVFQINAPFIENLRQLGAFK